MPKDKEPDERKTELAVGLQRQIDEYTERIVALYDRWRDVSEGRKRVIAKFSAPEQYEELRNQLEEVNREDDEIGAEIARLDDELNHLYDALRLARGQVQEPEERSDPLKLQQVALHRRLNEIADLQIAAVRQWNQHPVEEDRAAFEEELQRLHEEFTEVLKQLDRLSTD